MDDLSLAENAAITLEAAKVLIDLTAGYRSACIASGFSEHAAEHMAIDYHRSLLMQVVA